MPNKENRKIKVVMVYYALLHYRKSLFDYLTDSALIDFSIICGKKSQFANSKYYESDKGNIVYIKNRFFHIFGSLFFIQFPVVKKLLNSRPEAIILRGVNPQIVSMLYAFLAMKIFRPRTKIYWWGHGTVGHQGKIGILIRKFFYKYSDGVLLQGIKGIKILKDIGIAEDKLHVIGNNMNNASLGYRNVSIANKAIKDHLKIIYIGRLVIQKRVDLLILALAELKKEGKKFHCELIGAGPEDQKLKTLVKENNLSEEVSFRGALFEEELTPYFLNSDLTIIPDYAGLSIIHGLSYGLPFITSDDFPFHGPEIEVLQENINGSIYSKGSVDGLKTEIQKWEEKLSVPNSIADQCIESISEYTTEFVGENILNIIAKTN